MFDQAKFGVRDFAASKTSHLQALEPIGVNMVTDWPTDGTELSQPTGGEFTVPVPNRRKASAVTHRIRAGEPASSECLYAAAFSAGGVDNGPPGLRPEYSGQYYAAFVMDPGGHNSEVVCHETAV